MAKYDVYNQYGHKVKLESYPMEYKGDVWESVDLEPEPGYALYSDLQMTIDKVGNDIEIILQSADKYRVVRPDTHSNRG